MKDKLNHIMNLTDEHLFKQTLYHEWSQETIPVYKYHYSNRFSHVINLDSEKQFYILLREYPPLFENKPFYISIGCHFISPALHVIQNENLCRFVSKYDVLELVNNVCAIMLQLNHYQYEPSSENKINLLEAFVNNL